MIMRIRTFEEFEESTAFGISTYRDKEEEKVRKIRPSRYDVANKRSYGMSERKRRSKRR